MRPFFWNIPLVWLFYLLSFLALLSLGLGLALHLFRWAAGHRDETYKDLSLKSLIVDAALGRRIWRDDPLAGLAHLGLMWGFAVLFAGTLLLGVHEYIWPLLQGRLYLIYALVLDLSGLVFLLGVVLAAGRRYVWRKGLMTATFEDALVLALLFGVGLTGFLVEGARLAQNPGPELAWSPAGALLAKLWAEPSPATLACYQALWWLHALLGLGLVGLFVYLKLFHALAAPLNLAWADRPRPVLTIDQREQDLPEFSLGHLVAFDACTQCNRCELACPSTAAREGLSPRDYVLRGRKYARLKYSRLNRLSWYAGRAARLLKQDSFPEPDLAWLCTTCRACAEVCPVLIEPVSIIGHLRTAIVEEGREVPLLLTKALEGVQKYQNPWLKPRPRPAAWTEGLDLKTAGDGQAEWLYFAGCTVPFDERLVGMVRAGIGLLAGGGADLGALGPDEPCCGDMPRRAGEDGLFEVMVEQNLELFSEMGIRKIVTASPHCAETLKNGYPAMAAALGLEAPDLEVRHYTELAAGLVLEGKIRFSRRVDKRVTFHDPCYLGRHLGIYQAPRDILGRIPGVTMVEMERCREKSFCCGGGGGRMWHEVRGETSMAEIRAQEAARTGAEVLVTACPYCLSMLADAVKTADLQGRLEVMDLMELAALAV